MKRIAFVVLLLLATRSTCADDEPRPDRGPAPGTRILWSVPDVEQQTDYTCGPASLSAVLAHWGVEAGERTIEREAHTDPEVGAEAEDMIPVAAKRGVEGEWRSGLTLETIASELAAGRPVMVMFQAWRTDPELDWSDAWDDGHYAVVIGLDDRAVYFEDPSLAEARGAIPREEFLERWHGWTIDGEEGERQGMLFRSRRAMVRVEKPGRVEWVRIE